MALFEVDFFSKALDRDVSVNVIMPEAGLLSPGGCKSLLLLHGKGDNHTKWLRRTSVERYAKRYGLAVIMPDAKKSFYADMICGGDYWTFISQEVLETARAFFPALSDRCEDNFVAGLSMGGYGALKMAFHYPHLFAKAASFSGGVDMPKRMKMQDARLQNAVCGGGDRMSGTDKDLRYLIRSLKERGRTIPSLYLCCGTEDFLYEDTLKFDEYLNQLGVEHLFESWRGQHDWDFWDLAVEKGIRFLMES